MATSIEWTDVTDNIIVAESGGWWCRKISPGCTNCYAAKLNQSPFYGGNKRPYTGDAPPLILRREILSGWARQTKPKRHFVASMTDVFGGWVIPEWHFEMLDAMAAAPRQTFQVLTKRPDVAAASILAWLDFHGRTILPDNIWIGTSVEDQTRADDRIWRLLCIPAKVRFLSCEPLLGPVDLIATAGDPPNSGFAITDGFGRFDGEGLGIHWVIAGGESGPKARPVHPDWIHSLRDQCQSAGVPFLFKQWGEWGPKEETWPDDPSVRQFDDPASAGKLRRWETAACSDRKQIGKVTWNAHDKTGRVTRLEKIGKKAAGRHLDGREWNEFPA